VADKDTGLGGEHVERSLGFIPSTIFLVNNVIGSGLIALPAVYQEAGWVLSTTALCVIALFSMLAAAALVEVHQRTVAHMDGEYYHMSKLLFKPPVAAIIQVALISNLVALNIGAQIEACQIVDWFWQALVGKACALVIAPSPGAHCVEGDIQTDISPFDVAFLISPGLVCVMAICIPLSLVNIKENMWFQYLSFGLGLGVPLIWAILMAVDIPLDTNRLPATISDSSSLLGVVYLNFNFAVTLPSWANEKLPDVSTNSVIYTAVTTVLVLYLVVSCLGALAFADLDGDVISTKLQAKYGLTSFCSFTVFTFGATQLISQIPIFALIARKNIVRAGWMSRNYATALVLFSTWSVTIGCYTGNTLDEFLKWSGMILVPIVDFLVPMIALAILSVPGSMLFKWIEHPDSTQTQLQLDVKPEVYDACATEDSTTNLAVTGCDELGISVQGKAETHDHRTIFWDTSIEPRKVFYFSTALLVFGCVLEVIMLANPDG